MSMSECQHKEYCKNAKDDCNNSIKIEDDTCVEFFHIDCSYCEVFDDCEYKGQLLPLKKNNVCSKGIFYCEYCENHGNCEDHEALQNGYIGFDEFTCIDEGDFWENGASWRKG